MTLSAVALGIVGAAVPFACEWSGSGTPKSPTDACGGNALILFNIYFLTDNFIMKRNFFWIFIFIFCGNVFCEKVDLSYKGGGGYSLVERTDLRRYVNGKYTGLTSREIRSFVSPAFPPSKKFLAKGSIYEKDIWFDGSFYVIEQTLRNNQDSFAGIHDCVQSVFHISPAGKLTMYKDNGYPSFRSFPTVPKNFVETGDSWIGEGERAVDPLNKGIFTRIPMLVEYVFCGEDVYKGENVFLVKGRWQTKYDGNCVDFKGDSSLIEAKGRHEADIIIRKKNGVPLLISDKVDETFFYADGTAVSFKGTISNFTDFPPAVDENAIFKRAGNTYCGVDVEKTPAGIKLSLKNIRFLPDSDEVLEEEKERLDELAEILKMAAEGTFLVEGYTASTGKPEGEKILSEKRAKKIALEMKNRGVNAQAFICRGWGSKNPVASNETEEGRSLNRRVEITVLQ